MQLFRSSNHTRAALFTGIALLCTAGVVLADDPTSSSRPPPTKEMREKMAKAHEEMAVCLRSDRAIEECHSEMMKNHDMMMHDHTKHEHSTAPATPPAQQ
jgi:hypothetical protein